jgi:integrase
MSGERLFKRGRIWFGWYYQDGARVQRSTRCTDKRAAATLVAQWEREAADPDYSTARRALIRDAIALVLERADELARTERRSKATASFYHAKAGHLSRLLEPDGAPVPLRTLKASTIDAYVTARRRERASDATIAKELGVLRVALKLARRAGLWLGETSAVMPVLQGSGYVPRSRWLPPGELLALLRELVPDRAARAAFIVGTGARWSESETVERENVTSRFVALRGTKTTLSARAVPIVTLEQAMLVDHALAHAEGAEALFLPWPNVRRDLRAACVRAKIAPCSPNDLRRTFAHWLRSAGAPSDLVAPAMGHADARMVQRVYGRLEGEELASALRHAVAPVQQPSRSGRSQAHSPESKQPDTAGNRCPESESNQRHEDFQSEAANADVHLLLPKPKKPHHARSAGVAAKPGKDKLGS